jgi:hypothetical protein
MIDGLGLCFRWGNLLLHRYPAGQGMALAGANISKRLAVG